jgi:MoaA/NifB/PqqE/SkfB family radical SAM enzyme
VCIEVEPTMTLVMTEARKRNQQLNMEEFAQRATRLRSRPLALFIELTENCNLNCPMCRSARRYNPKFNMSRDLFERIADELFPHALVVDLRGYGESTILKDFDHLVRVTLNHQPRIRLVTNGQADRPDIWEQLMDAGSMIALSCDAATPELFAKLRAGGTLERFKRTARSIVQARNRAGADRDLVVFNTVASLDNLDELPDVVSVAASLDVARVVLFPVQTPLGSPSHLRGDVPRTRAAYLAAAERARSLGIDLQLGAAPDAALAQQHLVKTHPCMHPWGYTYINYSGGVGFCDHLIGDHHYILGSLWKRSFEDIWNGPEWVALREGHVAGAIPDRFFPCRWCFAQRYVDFEHLIHPAYGEGIVSSSGMLPVVADGNPNDHRCLPWM